MVKTTLILGTVLAMLTPAPVHATTLDLSRRKYGAIMADAYYDTLAQCETGTNWQHSTRSYTGGLGINRGTAHRWSGHRNLARMTPRQQIRIADRIAFSGWTNKAGTYVWPVGPFGWGCVRKSATLRAYLCASHHRRVQKYRHRACHG